MYFLNEKIDAFNNFERYKTYVEKVKGLPIKDVRADNEGEFTSKDFHNFCDENKIQRQLTFLRPLELNVVAKRKCITILKRQKVRNCQKCFGQKWTHMRYTYHT